MAKYVRNFSKWAKEWYNKAIENDNIDFASFRQKVCIVCNVKTGKCGLARCSPQDSFDTEIGFGIAYARLCNEEIPKEILRIQVGKLQNGDLFKLRRFNSTYSYIFIGKDPSYTDNPIVALNENTRKFERLLNTLWVDVIK